MITHASVFVGREAELGAAAAALQAARDGSPQVLLVEGEPGIGKSAFVRRVVTLAADVVVLEASGEEGEQALAYGVLAQLQARAAAADTGAAAEGWSTGSGGVALPSESASVFTAGGELLAALGVLQESAPVLLVVDDAHWMDRASARALLFAVRRLYADRVLIVLALRPDGLEQLADGWSRLANDPARATPLRLSGLSGTEIGLLADSIGFGPLSAAAAERLCKHTGGHPLYVKSLLRELSRDVDLDHGPLPAPHSFAATVLTRLAGVNSAAQDLVAAVAVAGERCAPSMAALVARLADPLDALDEALAADLLALVPRPSAEQVEFAHPLIRAAVYDDLSLSRRRDLHLAWSRVTSGSVSLAHRVAASDGSDDDLAGELMAAARDEVAAGRATQGADRFLSAARVAASQSRREIALLSGIEYLGLAGDVPRAHGLRDRVVACRDSPRRSFALSTLSASAGRVEQARAALTEVLARPDFAQAPELLGPVTSSLAIICAYAGRGEEAVHWGRRALTSPSPPPTAIVTARQALAMGLALSRRCEEGIETLASLSPSRIEPAPYEAELLATRGSLKALYGDLTGAVNDLSAVVRWARAGFALRSLPNAYGSLAETEYRLGRWDEGLTHAELAVSLAQDSDHLWELSFVNAVASFVPAGRGDWDTAAAHVRAAAQAAELAPLPLGVAYACFAEAHLAAMRGDWNATLSAVARVRKLTADGATVDLGQFGWRVIELAALLRTGALDAAAAAFPELDRSLSAKTSNAFAVQRCWLWGALQAARGDRAAARAAFAEGQQLPSESPMAAGMLNLAFGQFLRKTNSRKAAAQALSTAREQLAGLRARPLLAQCDAELAACGARVGSRAFADGLALTPREEVVARSAAAGKSNREIASELYLSTKAVEYHLANVFRKGQIRSRHQLPSLLARL